MSIKRTRRCCMSAGQFPIRVLSLALALASPFAPALLAQDEQVPVTAENSKQSAAGVINGNAVYVHSGAGQNYYAVTKLDKGAKVTVVGIKFDWLKILPPEGTFSYVAKAFVERVGDGTVGRVTRPELNVRAGSTLNDMKAIVQTKLDQGAEVQIIGEKDEYFMIKPPAGSYCYVNKQYVDYSKEEPVLVAKPVEPTKQAEAPTASNEQPQQTETPTQSVAPETFSTNNPPNATGGEGVAPAPANVQP